MIGSKILHIHNLAIEAMISRHLMEDARQTTERQRDALIRLIQLPESAPGRVEKVKKALMFEGVTSLWTEARFISPLVASSAFFAHPRTFGRKVPVLRPILVMDSESIFGVRHDGFEDIESFAEKDVARFVMSTSRATLRAFTEPNFVYEAMSDIRHLIDKNDDQKRGLIETEHGQSSSERN